MSTDTEYYLDKMQKDANFQHLSEMVLFIILNSLESSFLFVQEL